MQWRCIWALVLFASLAGCTGRPQVTYSGFLKDYSQLKPHPEVEGAMLYENPAKNLKQYDKFIVDPVLIHFAPSAEGTAIDPEDLKGLTEHFRNALVKGLSESRRYQVVDAAGPGVLQLRIAITAISKTTPVANIHPGTKLTGIGLGGAAMEAEALDSVSGERVAAVVDSQSGGRMGVTAGLTRYGHAEQVMDGWVERIIKRLDKAHGYTK
jgi:hypothetical protein